MRCFAAIRAISFHASAATSPPPEDLATFGNAHLQPGFLKADTLRQLFTTQKTADGM